MGSQGFYAVYHCGTEAAQWVSQEWERIGEQLEAQGSYADVYVGAGPCGVKFSASVEDWGDVDMVARLVTSAQRQFPNLPPFYMEYGRWPMYSDASPYGGGALVCRNGEALRLDTHEWLLQQGMPEEG